MRADRIVLVGQGDLMTHRIDKLLLVDYDTETVLHEFPASDVVAKCEWKYRTEIYPSDSAENQQSNTAPASNAAPLPLTDPSNSGENKAVQPVPDTAQSDKTASNAAAAAARPVSRQCPSGSQWVSTPYGGYCK